jgi:hypothetical protein
MQRLAQLTERDPGIAEFSRFYSDRREVEVRAAGDDELRRNKLKNEFSPALSRTLVALEGKLHRQLKLRVRYKIGSSEHESSITVSPHSEEVIEATQMGRCAKTGRAVPADCLSQCALSGAIVLKHLLLHSEQSDRRALAEHTLLCSLSGRRIIVDEAERSGISGQMVAKSLLMTSALSGKRGERSGQYRGGQAHGKWMG